MQGLGLVSLAAAATKDVVFVMQVTRTMPVPEFLKETLELAAPVNAYFDKVFVMTDNEGVKQNRLALLQQIAALSDGIVDFTKLPGF